MQTFALALIQRNEPLPDPTLLAALAAVIPRIYLIDGRAEGARFVNSDDSRIHYAPFRQKTTLGTALNRALNLAYEEGKTWLWVLSVPPVIGMDDLQSWSQKASPNMSLYLGDSGSQSLLRRLPCVNLVAVATARKLGGWDTALPAPLVFADFVERLQNQGYPWQKGYLIPADVKGHGLDVLDGLQSMLILMRKRFLQK